MAKLLHPLIFGLNLQEKPPLGTRSPYRKILAAAATAQ